MALPVTNKFEGGSDDVSISTGNSGGSSGTAFDAVTIGTNAVVKYENSQFAHGGLSMEYSTTTSASAFVSWTTAMGTQATVYGRFYIRLSALPGTSGSVFSTNTGATARARIQVTSAGKLRVLDSTGATTWTSTTTLSVDTWYRVEFGIFHDTSAGTVQVKLYTLDSTSATEDSGVVSSVNFGDVSCTGIRFGAVANATNWPQTWFDDLQVNNTGFPGAANTTVTGTGTLPVEFTCSGTGTRTTAGTPADAAFAFTSSASGTPTVLGTVATEFVFAAPATGSGESTTKNGIGTLSLTFSAPAVGHVRPPYKGWYDLLSIVREPAVVQEVSSCPNDGEPLVTSPNGGLFCSFDGYTTDNV